MDVKAVETLISTIGFPTACCICMAWFIYTIYKNMVVNNEKNMENMQIRCQEREEKLYKELAENRKINDKALDTIRLYAERLTNIENSINHIESDVLIIKDRLE